MKDFFGDNLNYVNGVKKKSKMMMIDDVINEHGLYSELVNRLKLGISKSLIFEWLIGMGINFDKSNMYRYFDYVIKKVGIMNIDGYNKLNTSIVKKLDSGLSELDELNRLYKMQMERIGIDFETEKKIKKLFKTTGYEVYLASKILSDIVRIKMELGIIDKKKFSEFEGANINVINFGGNEIVIDERSRRKVLAVLEDIKKLDVSNIDLKDKIIQGISDKIEGVVSNSEDSGNGITNEVVLNNDEKH